jgi:hypothetical protein
MHPTARINRRPGRFFLTRQFQQSLSLEAALAIQAEVIILSVRDDFMMQTTEFRGLSRHFRELKDGDTIPVYRVTIRSPLPGVYVCDWTECDHEPEPCLPENTRRPTILERMARTWKRIRGTV